MSTSLEHVSSSNTNNFNSHSHKSSNHHSASHKQKLIEMSSENNSNKSSSSKNVKIASCMDKWYKELKGQVLSEFEKSRLQLLQEQQKKLLDEKEK